MTKIAPTCAVKKLTAETDFTATDGAGKILSGKVDCVTLERGSLSAGANYGECLSEVSGIYGVYGFGNKIAYAADGGIFVVNDSSHDKLFAADFADKPYIFVACGENATAYLFADEKLYVSGSGDMLADLAGRVITDAAVCGGRLFCAIGRGLFYADVGSRCFGYAENGDGGKINFSSDIQALCACGDKLYVFAGEVYVVETSFDHEYFTVKRVAAAFRKVSYAATLNNKIYCFTSGGLYALDKPSVKLKPTLGNPAETTCRPCAFDGKLYFCDCDGTYAYDPESGAEEVSSMSFTTLATDGKNLYACDGTHVFRRDKTALAPDWQSKAVDFGIAGRKHLRKLSVKGVGSISVTVYGGDREFTLQLDDADGTTVDAPCYIDGNSFVVYAKFGDDSRVDKIKLVGVSYQKEVNV